MSNKKIKNSKRKCESDNDDELWSKLSRDELIQRCKQLEKHVEQLKNTIVKKNEQKTNMRPFDFSKHPKRHIFLKFFYLGWEYHVRIREIFFRLFICSNNFRVL